MADVLLGLGSNLGDREAHLREALRALAGAVGIVQVSALYETDPVGYLAQGAFLNAVTRGETVLAPHVLLRVVKSIEQQLGRSSGVRWGPRVLDIDILAYDDLSLDDEELRLPHPRLAERAFVLVPLVEIAPHWRHPELGKTAEELLGSLGKVEGVRLYKRGWWAT